jgi:hypothetical protein
MKNFKSLLTNPYTLSLIPSVLIVLLIHKGLSKYLLESDSSILLPENHYAWFNDLDNDGSSEKIIAFDQDNSTGLAISAENGIIEQWNFRGNFNFYSKNCLFITGDKDNNGKKEVYAFTLSNDSILLNCISDFKDPLPSVRNRLIAVAGKGIKSPDPFIIPAEMEDLDNDGIKELIFGIGSGFSGYPRNVFAYYISKDSLVVSPQSSYFIMRILQTDITGDGIKEIIPFGYATCNIGPEKAKYHDYSSFLMVLDQNLKFLFNPVEFKGKFSKLSPFVKQTENGNSLHMLFNQASGEENSVIYRADSRGVIADSIKFPFYIVDCINISENKNTNVFLIVMQNKGLGLLNENFKLIKFSPAEGIFKINQNDFDNDTRREILLEENEASRISIYREGLTNPVSVDLQSGVNSEFLISMKLSKQSDPLISVQSGKKIYFLKYRRNPAYPYYYLSYVCIYLGILGFALIIRNIQKNQLKKKYDNEKKISQLQLALIRNQLDPHFSLNVINSIIYSIEYADRKLAGEQLRQYANLYRNLLLSASSIQRSIEEELDFCRDYLLLEKIRFNEKFNFRISVSDDINKNILIPKLLIQLHVENALKHGLMPLISGGNIDINLRSFENGIYIEIADNGVGRAKAMNEERKSTGKGLEIMSELYSIYNKYYNEKISSEIIDLFDINGRPAGTKVLLKIFNPGEKTD